VFNFADISILSGVFILIYLILSMKNKKKEINLVPQLVEDREDPD
jgi:lipoprotein signal peptidase